MPRSPKSNGDVSRSVSRSRSRSPKERSSRRKRSYTRSPSPNTSKRLHVANIDDSIRRRDIEDSFSKFGKLEDVWVASYPPLYAFVVFQEAADASSALKEMRSGYIRDVHIKTTVALPRNSGRRGPPPRRFSPGGYRGDRRGGRDDYRGGRDRRDDRRRSRSPPPRRERRRSRSRS